MGKKNSKKNNRKNKNQCNVKLKVNVITNKTSTDFKKNLNKERSNENKKKIKNQNNIPKKKEKSQNARLANPININKNQDPSNSSKIEKTISTKTSLNEPEKQETSENSVQIQTNIERTHNDDNTKTKKSKDSKDKNELVASKDKNGLQPKKDIKSTKIQSTDKSLKKDSKSVNFEKDKTSKKDAKNLNINGNVENQSGDCYKGKDYKVLIFIKPLMFILFAVCLELINFQMIQLNTDNSGTTFPIHFGIELGIILVYAGLLFNLQKVWLQNLFMYLFLVVMTVLSVVNQSLMNMQGFMLNLSMLSLLGEAKNSFSWDFVDFVSLFATTFFLLIMVVIQIAVDKLLKNKKFWMKQVFQYLCLGLGIFFAVAGSMFFVFDRVKMDEYENKLYSYQFSSQEFFKNFGTLAILTQPLSVTKTKLETDEILTGLEQNLVEEDPEALFSGDNLIMIMVESMDSFAIDPYNTPTLYSLTQNGYYFDHYYSNNKTNISEFASLNGYVPNSTAVKLNSNNDLAVKYSLPNLFKSKGYTANYFHSFTGSFYNRNTLNIQMGFDDVIDRSDAGLEDINFNYWTPEQDYLDKVIKKLAPTDGTKFMSFYLTVATHGLYTIELEGFQKYLQTYDENLENFKTYLNDNGFYYPSTMPDTESSLRIYKSRMMETDDMVKKLLNYLDETGLSNNTNLVIFGDHNAYYHDLTYRMKGSTQKSYSNLNNYNVPLIFYSKKLGSKLCTNSCTVADIYTSICELYGLEYNNYICQGRNLFDENIPEFFMFSILSGYYSDYYYGYSPKTTVKIKNEMFDEKEKQKEFSKLINEFSEKQIRIIEIQNKKLKA